MQTATADYPQPVRNPYVEAAKDLGDQISDLYAHINLATFELLQLIQQFDAQFMGPTLGFLTTAQWLSYRCGIGLVAAREKVRVANALAELPVISAAFGRGEVSYSKVRALTRVADPLNETKLLYMARHSTASQAERILREYRQTVARSASVSPMFAAATAKCSWYNDENGNLVMRATLPADMGELVKAALTRIVDANAPLESSGHPDFSHPDFTEVSARRAYALVELAENGLASTGSSADRYLVHVEIEAGDRADHLSRQNGGQQTGLHSAVVEKLTCDGALIGHQSDADGTPLAVGRKTRVVSGALRRALTRRDRGCRFPGCPNHRFVDAHHVRHWAHGGETSLDNTVLLCRRHHTMIHQDRFRIEAKKPDRGAIVFRFYSPQGELIPPVADDLTAGNVVAINPDFRDSAESPRDHVTNGIDSNQLIPVTCEARPDYEHINWVLANFVPRLE